MRKLLLILLLCPVLTLATETEFESLEEELAAERRELVEDKVAQLRHMQEIMETVQHSEAVQEEAEREPGPLLIFIVNAYGVGFMIVGTLAAAFFAFFAIKATWECLRFNYHYYIEYGDYRLFPTSDFDIKRQMKVIIDKLDYATMEGHQEFSWAGCLGYTLLAGVFILVLVIIWPISLIMFGPEIVTELVAHKRRKKTIFEKKLKGEQTHGVV